MQDLFIRMPAFLFLPLSTITTDLSNPSTCSSLQLSHSLPGKFMPNWIIHISLIFPVSSSPSISTIFRNKQTIPNKPTYLSSPVFSFHFPLLSCLQLCTSPNVLEYLCLEHACSGSVSRLTHEDKA